MVSILDMSVFWAVAMDEHFSNVFPWRRPGVLVFQQYMLCRGCLELGSECFFWGMYCGDIGVLGRCFGGALGTGGLVAIPWFGKLGTDAACGPGAFCLEAMAWASAAGLSLGDYWRDGLYVDSINKLLTGQA